MSFYDVEKDVDAIAGGQVAMHLMRAGVDMRNESIIFNDTYGGGDRLDQRVISFLRFAPDDDDHPVDENIWNEDLHAWVGWTA